MRFSCIWNIGSHKFSCFFCLRDVLYHVVFDIFAQIAPTNHPLLGKSHRGNGRSAQPCVQSRCSVSSAAGWPGQWGDTSGQPLGLPVAGLPPSLSVVAKLSSETGGADFLTSPHCSGPGLVRLDHWKGLEMLHRITWMYQPESALVQTLHCPPLHD